jgi:hypothetical protein
MATDKRHLDIDPDAPPSAEEIAESARLREALADASKPSEDADLLRALANAHAPRELDRFAHGAIVSRALSRGAPAQKRQGRQARVLRVSFGVAAVLAAAALVILFIRTRLPRPDGTGGGSGTLAQIEVSRSTQPLFDAPFAPQGGESARMDRIAMAREADLRQNRFAQWGVR